MPKQVRPKDETKPESKTIAQWIQEYKDYYWLSRDKKRYEDNENWEKGYLRYFKYVKDWNVSPTKEIFDDACMSYPKSVKRNECCTRIKYLAQFCGLKSYNPKEFRLKGNQIKVRAKAKRELTDTEVETWFNKFPNMATPNGRSSPWQLWQWMFGMQAAYGFRNHETLNIFNLTQDYTGEDGRLYPAFTDKERNPRGIVYTEGKGVKRAALAPRPIKWLEKFNLREVPGEYFEFINQIKNYAQYDKKRAKVLKLKNYGRFLKDHGFTFTAYNLRHPYNVKSHLAGVPASIIAKNLAHTLAMNTSIYLESQGIKSCLEALDNLENKQTETNDKELTIQQQMESLKHENEQLKAPGLFHSKKR